MNKSELIKVFSEKFDIRLEAATEIVGLFFDAIRKTLLDGDRVEIRGFGAFKMKQYKGYRGRNPKTGKVAAVRPKRLPFFKQGAALKAYMNRGE